MKKCIVCHTGIYLYTEGFIKNNKVYVMGDDEELYYPEILFMAKEDCEKGFIQIIVDEKWGFANIYTGEILVEPIWDYAGPYYFGYAQVSSGAKVDYKSSSTCLVEGGKHGFIDMEGNVIVPLEYDYVKAKSLGYKPDTSQYEVVFMVSKNDKSGVDAFEYNRTNHARND